ncbi:hypothetical protein BFU36_03200 [Sulfolobus sp. A20]|uniref:V-type ATP synthase subunit E n=1 Tax=Sulfolobaceae TaxID=118883 RepID=UPI000846241A|nr:MULTISPECIES: V-type ATP synthase subunit E [unclassified Sulfolobus]TRM78583.1 hypothetical protein DJ532_00945 [Sulfolobus sp. A20-N-F8]TRM86123.1 hypothetical protein DJ529_12015 [Sulfolobus sp. C3]TRN02486.1 hypothetical protein DJ530_04375 [Sulfolobus sp. E1]TRN03927.1 hypothetical protein DJ527_01260 [Sulfolobus sp. F1]AOL15891.1 hypothetical protein BFU36_03200 [Sulfolobus sp. A20]
MEFEDLLNLSINKIKEEIDNELKKSLEESIKLLEDGYQNTIREFSQRLQDYVSKTKEEIEGEKARLEVENKRAILAEKEYWINKVYERILDKISDITKSKEYSDSIKSILSRELKEGEPIVIYCSSSDEKLIRSLVKNKNVTIKTDNKMLGGIKIYYEKSGLSKDFSLKLILDQVFDSMRGKIADILFGGA